jgi:DNA modification methylase
MSTPAKFAQWVESGVRGRLEVDAEGRPKYLGLEGAFTREQLREIVARWDAADPPSPAASPWQPIETAPRDGSTFLARRRARVGWPSEAIRECYVVKRDDGCVWVFGGTSFHERTRPNNVPDEWMPIPG